MQQPPLKIDGHSLEIADVVAVARHNQPTVLAESARKEMLRSYEWVSKAGTSDQAIYGVNTGFGSLARVRIPPENSACLSLNLVRSHAAGVGKMLPEDVTRATMLLRANALAKGVSGCRPLLVETLLMMLNRGVTPVIPSQGSCGSSGDLAPLAHLGLVITEGDHGEAMYNGERMTATAAMAKAKIPRLTLQAKDGLAITNGAQVTTAIAALACHDAQTLVLSAEIAAAMSIEALRGVTRAFHPAVHKLRPYQGAMACAANICTLTNGSGLLNSVSGKVQDAYSLRCSPQVIGAARDTIAFTSKQITIELNAATDNPLILMDVETEDGNQAFSAGMFHGEPIGLAADTLKIAVAEIASISERRLYRLTTGSLSARLPPALVGLDRPEIGLMLPHTTAAALVSENKALAWPASVDSIPTCEDQEDHVAMSTTAARRAAAVVANSQRVIAIELLGAAAALAFRRHENPALILGAGSTVALQTIESALQDVKDSLPGEQIEHLATLLASGGLFVGMPQLLPVGATP